MATGAALDFRVEVNAVVLSAWCTNVSLPLEFAALEDTAYGDVSRSRVFGLIDTTLALSFNQDFAASAVDATLSAAFFAKAPITVKVRPTTAAITATNPEYVAAYLPNQYSPFGTGVGDLQVSNVSWPLANAGAAVARNTS